MTSIASLLLGVVVSAMSHRIEPVVRGVSPHEVTGLVGCSVSVSVADLDFALYVVFSDTKLGGNMFMNGNGASFTASS